MSRFIKKIVYGFLFLFSLVVILLAVYFIFIKSSPTCSDNKQNQNETEIDCGGPCLPCAIKNVKDLSNSAIEMFAQDGGLGTILFSISNPNPTLGIEKIPFSIILFDNEGNRAVTVNQATSIAPGESKFIIESGVKIDLDFVSRAEIKLDYNLDSWKTKTELPPQPLVELVDYNKKLLPDGLKISGDILNRGSSAVPEYFLGVILTNDLGIKISAAKKSLGRIEAFGKKTFEFIIPLKKELLKQVNLDEVVVFIEF